MEAALAFFRALRQGGKRRIGTVESRSEPGAGKIFGRKFHRMISSGFVDSQELASGK
jgi:hypothetical protein